jgi:hypothetical protein
MASSPAPAGIDAPPAAARYVLASAGEDGLSGLMFNPSPTYTSAVQPASPAPAQAVTARPASAGSPSATAALPQQSASHPPLPPQLASAGIEAPAEVLAYADEPAPRPQPNPAARRPVQAPHSASTGPASPSNAVLNDAQIASIRERLKLTSYQSQLWPPVESALRDISWQARPDAGRKIASNATSIGHGATVDPNSQPVQRLKSAAFPLLMSLSEEQKQEVRTMVRLMGLESLASQI